MRLCCCTLHAPPTCLLLLRRGGLPLLLQLPSCLASLCIKLLAAAKLWKCRVLFAHELMCRCWSRCEAARAGRCAASPSSRLSSCACRCSEGAGNAVMWMPHAGAVSAAIPHAAAGPSICCRCCAGKIAVIADHAVMPGQLEACRRAVLWMQRASAMRPGLPPPLPNSCRCFGQVYHMVSRSAASSTPRPAIGLPVDLYANLGRVKQAGSDSYLSFQAGEAARSKAELIESPAPQAAGCKARCTDPDYCTCHRFGNGQGAMAGSGAREVRGNDMPTLSAPANRAAPGYFRQCSNQLRAHLHKGLARKK